MAHPGTRSVFQIGGAGSVGTGSIRGMPYLPVLRVAGMAVWPFDDWPSDGRPVVTEVWPRSFIGPVVKSSPADRARFWGSRRFADEVCGSPDAFDAACAAIGLSLAQPPTVTLDAIDRIEGRIFP